MDGPFIVTTKRPTSPPAGALVALDRCCAACGAVVGQLPVMPAREPELRHQPECPRSEWPWRDAVLDIEGESVAPRDWSIVSRLAVATLEEARGRAGDLVAEMAAVGWQAFDAAAQRLPESGGTVGPLPDGTVIEVEARDWGFFGWNHIEAPFSSQATRILATYNARKAGHA